MREQPNSLTFQIVDVYRVAGDADRERAVVLLLLLLLLLLVLLVLCQQFELVAFAGCYLALETRNELSTKVLF